MKFADAVRKQNLGVENGEKKPKEIPPLSPPKSATQQLADALKNKTSSATTNSPKTGGGIKFGIKTKTKGNGADPSPSTAQGSEPKLDIEKRVSLPNSSGSIPSEVPTPITGEDFIHPEQPEGFTEEAVQSFKNAVAFLHSSLPHKEESPQAMRLVLRMLEEEPHLTDLMLPEDCGAMVQVLKTSFGAEIAKKQTRTAKTKKSEETQNELDDLLNAMGADFGTG